MSIEAKTALDINKSRSSEAPKLRKKHETSGFKKVAKGITALGIAATLISDFRPASGQVIQNYGVNPSPLAGEVLPTVEPSKGYTETVNDVLSEIKNEYGVVIPAPSDEFSQEDRNNGSKLESNTLPTYEEAKIIEEALSNIPSPDKFAPLIICFNNPPGNDNTANGSQLGWQWPAFLHPSEFTAFPPNNFPYDRLADTRPAFELNLPSAKMSDPLPKVDPLDNLPLVTALVFQERNITPKSDPLTTMPVTTQRERLKQVVTHEPFHNIQDAFSLANSKDIKDYWSRQNFNLYDMETGDVTNPLYVTFAKLNGWILVPDSETIKQYDPKYAASHADVISKWTSNHYQRDPKIWGDDLDRNVRVSIYASYGPIQEAMAEYWTAYKLYPQLLTPNERQYFSIIDKGLKNNPQEFITEVVKNPNILLADDHSSLASK